MMEERKAKEGLWYHEGTDLLFLMEEGILYSSESSLALDPFQRIMLTVKLEYIGEL